MAKTLLALADCFSVSRRTSELNWRARLLRTAAGLGALIEEWPPLSDLQPRVETARGDYITARVDPW